MALTVDTDLARSQSSLDRDEHRLETLEATELSDFPKAAQLSDLSDQVSQLRREIKEAETSPEALARNDARAERAAAKGREPGWSLLLNPTPAKVEETGLGSADAVRAMMRERERNALTGISASPGTDPDSGAGSTYRHHGPTPTDTAPDSRSDREPPRSRPDAPSGPDLDNGPEVE